MKHTLLILIALLCATACPAQTTLEACQQQAQQNYPLIQAARTLRPIHGLHRCQHQERMATAGASGGARHGAKPRGATARATI